MTKIEYTSKDIVCLWFQASWGNLWFFWSEEQDEIRVFVQIYKRTPNWKEWKNSQEKN